MTTRFRKRPVEVAAVQWFKNGDHPDDGPADREGQVVRYFRRPDIPGDRTCRHCPNLMHDHGWIDTLEGGHIVCPGDWVVTGVNGERYPVKPDIFEATYEPVPVTPCGHPEDHRCFDCATDEELLASLPPAPWGDQ